MSQVITTVNKRTYEGWFKILPPQLQAEMEQGPLGYLHESLRVGG